MDNIMTQKRQAFYSIDIAKFLSAFAVIGIHTQVFSCFGDLANYYSFGVFFRLAVAFFFVCSGYFFFRKLEFANGKILNCVDNKKKLASYVKRIFVLYVIWSLVYFLLQFIQWLQNPDISFFHLMISFASSFIIDGSYYHLWYILCLIYAFPIIYFLLSKFNFKTVTILAVLLYIIHLLMNLNNIVSGLPGVALFSKLYVIPGAIGQTIFIAIPLITLGGYLSNYDCSASKKKIVTLDIASIIMLIAESSLIYFLTDKRDYSSYIFFTFVVAVLGFLLLIKSNISTNNPKVYKYLRSMSTLIYCVHPLIISIFKIFVDYRNINSIIWFAIISAVCIIISFILIFLSQKIRIINYLY